MLSRIRAAGIEHVVLGTSYKAETFTEYFGDGSAFGLTIEYVIEDEPLGTGGAIRNVADRLRADTVMVFNGDILSGVDLGALLDTHTGNDADVTLHLVKVPDPRAFGSVPTDADGRVQAFLEKTENPPTDQINAGCYVFKRSVLEAIPAGRVVSVERETFPGLLASGARVFGHVDTSYWLDLGTPAAFVRGSADLVTGIAPTAALPGPVGAGLVLAGRRRGPPARADRRGDHRPRRRRSAAGAVVDGSVVFDGASIGAGAPVTRSVIGRRRRIGADAVLADAVIGDGAVIGERCELLDGVRVWPGVGCPRPACGSPPEIIGTRQSKAYAPSVNTAPVADSSTPAAPSSSTTTRIGRLAGLVRAHPTSIGVGAAVVGFLALCVLRIASLKPWVTADEYQHVDYALAVWRGVAPGYLPDTTQPEMPEQGKFIQHVANHPPLYPYLIGWILRLGVATGHSWVSVYLARGVTALIAAAAICLISATAYRLAGRRSAPAIGAALIAANCSPLVSVATTVMNDALFIALSCAVIYLMVVLLADGYRLRTSVLLVLAATADLLHPLQRDRRHRRERGGSAGPRGDPEISPRGERPTRPAGSDPADRGSHHAGPDPGQWLVLPTKPRALGQPVR